MSNNKNKNTYYYSTYNVLFKMWKYSLILPIFEYNKTEQVFKYKKSYFRFVNCFLLLILNYKIYTHKNEILSKTLVITFVIKTYRLFLYFISWFNILFIYFHIDHIENFSKTLVKLEEILKITENTKWERIEWKWLILTFCLSIPIIGSEIYFLTLNIDRRVMDVVTFRYFYFLDIISLHLIISGNRCSLLHYQKLNEDSEITNNPKITKLMSELQTATYHFMDVCSYMILSKCFYSTDTVIASLFMNMEIFKMNLSSWIDLCSCISICAWLGIQVSMIILVVHQVVGIHQEVGPFPQISNLFAIISHQRFLRIFYFFGYILKIVSYVFDSPCIYHNLS